MARVLVVDDSATMRKIIMKGLREAGFAELEFAEAVDGASALEALRKDHYDLVLSDINMPGMSGIELLPRAKEARPDVPVIMITAYGDAETRRKAIEAGAAGLFTKPIDFPELRGEIGHRLDAAAGPP